MTHPIRGPSTASLSPPNSSPSDPNHPSHLTPSQAAELSRLRTVPFGSRYLTNPEDVYNFNAWDHVVPPKEWEEQARRTLELQREGRVGEGMKWAYNNKPALYWDRFYKINKANFFKDRNWLRLEFPELLECAQADAGPKLVVEIGCGAGNTVFPLLARNENPDLVVHACDYSEAAVEVVKANEFYPIPSHGIGRMFSSVWDVTEPPVASQSVHPSASASTSKTASSTTRPSNGNGAEVPASAEGEQINDKVPGEGEATEAEAETEAEASPAPAPPTEKPTSLPEGIQPGTVDIAIMIFVMSALHPLEWKRAVANAWKMLKPNGLLFIRDYGRYDLAQLRMKKGRMLEEHFYVRGDGTRCYYFEAAELSEMLTGKKDAFTPMEAAEPTVEVEDSSANPEAGPSTFTPPVDSMSGSPVPGTPVVEVSEPTPEANNLASIENDAANISADQSAPRSREYPFRHKDGDLEAETLRLSKLAMEVQGRKTVKDKLREAAERGDETQAGPSKSVSTGAAVERPVAAVVPAPAPVHLDRPIPFHPTPPQNLSESLSTRFRTPSPAGIAPRVDFPNQHTSNLNGEQDASHIPTIDPFTTPHEELGVPENPLFRIDQMGVDRRMLVNRKRQLKMYRIWMQVKARKLV